MTAAPFTQTESGKGFRKNIRRARAFLRIFDADRGRGRPTDDENELLRVAVVYSIGALDAYLHELVLEIVPRFGGDRGRLDEALKQIARDDPGLALRVALATEEEKREEFRAALDVWLEKKSFQGFGKVQAALGYVGVKLTTDDLDAATGVNTAAMLSKYTDIRHEIVHRGVASRVRRTPAGDCVALVEAVGERIDQEVVATFG